MVTLNDQQGPAVVVSVSVFSADAQISAEGVLLLPQQHGNQFRMIGVPAHGLGGNVVSPETAVRLAAEASDSRVAEVPSLSWRGIGYWPVVGHWRVVLEKSVQAKIQDGKLISTDEVFISGDGSIRVPSGKLEEPIAEGRTPRALQGTEFLKRRNAFARELVPAVLIKGGIQ
jgi:hypothetical protein